MAPTLLLLALAHTLVLSLLPLVILHLPRLVRSAWTIQSSIVGASTLCVGLYGACALVALAGSGAEDGRVASLVAGTLACVGSLFMDIFLILNSCAAERQEQEADSRSRSTGDRLALAGLLSLLVLSATVLHVVLLCVAVPHSTALALSVGRAVLHLVFLALVSLLLLRKLFLDGPSFDAERCAHPEQTSTAGAWYAPSRASTRRIAKVFSPLAVLIVAQLFGIALDIMSVIFPVRENYTALDSIGGRSAPTLFGTTSSTTSYVVGSCLVLTRWALTLSVAGSTTSPARTLHPEHRSLTPSASVRHLRPHRSPSFNHFDSTFSSWAHPSPLATSRGPRTSSPDRLTAMAYRSPVQQSSASAHLGSSSAKRKAVAHTSFLSLGTTGDTEPSDQDALELDHPYMHSRLQTMPTSTYASSVDEADDEDEHGRSEDLVVPPSPSPFPGGRRTGRISPSLPPSFSQRRTSIAQRAHHSLPPLLTSTPPPSSSRAFPHAQAGNSTADELSSSPTLEQSFGRGRGRRTSSGLSTLPLLARTITRTFSPHGPSPSPSPALAAGPASPYRFPHNHTSSTSRSPDRARAPSHPSTDAPSSKYFSPMSSPRLVRPQPTRSASSSPRKMRRPSLPRLGSVPDARLTSTRSASPAAASALSSPFGGRRRSGSVGSLLRSVAAGRGLGGMSTGASGRSSTTPTPTGDMSFWEVEPNESEDDPFAARSVPPSISSASLRGARSVASLRPSSASGARSTLDVADEAGATKLRRALEAIHEPATEGSREGSARTSRYSAPAPGSDDEGEGLERVLTPAPAPSRASIDESTFGGASGLYRQASSTGSQFREHLDSPSPSPASSLSGATALHLGLVLPADNALGLETPVVSLPRRRTDQKSSMSPTVLTGRRPSLPLDRSVDVAAEEVQPQLLAFGASARRQPLHGSPSSSPPVQRESPFLTRRGSRIRPSILPVNSSPASLASTPPSSTVRRGSLLSRTKRTTSSPSLLMTSALALRRMRRRSPSPQEESRASESSGLSFACRGPSTSGSDLGSSLLVAHLRPQASAQSSSSEGGNAVEVVDVAGETTVQPGAAPVRRPWWNRLPGSRTGTPYLRSSASSMVPRRTSSSPGLSLARSASLGSSALIVPHSSLGSDSSASSSHMHGRSNSLPLDAMRWSQVQLPPIYDVSPFGSSIFDPRRSGSSDERRRRDPVPSFPASLAAQHALLPLPLDVHLAAGPSARTSFLSINSSAPSRTSSSLRRISEIRREDVVHQLDDLVGSLGAAFVGPAQASLSGSFEFPERNFASSAGTTLDVVDGEQAQQQSAHEPDVPVSPVTVGSSTPTRSPTSLASSTPLSALFSALSNVAGDDGEGWARRPSAASDALRSPLTPASGGLSASRWGSFSDAGGPAAAGEAGWMVWREKSSAASRPDEGAADGEHEETLETLEVDARRD